jgi:hypothetical protein
VILRHDPDGIYSYIAWNDFRDLVQPRAPKPRYGALTKSLYNPYYLLFGSIFDAVVFYQKRKGIFPSTVDFDFDEQGALARFPIMMWDVAKKQSLPAVRKMLGIGANGLLGVVAQSKLFDHALA